MNVFKHFFEWRLREVLQVLAAFGFLVFAIASVSVGPVAWIPACICGAWLLWEAVGWLRFNIKTGLLLSKCKMCTVWILLPIFAFWLLLQIIGWVVRAKPPTLESLPAPVRISPEWDAKVNTEITLYGHVVYYGKGSPLLITSNGLILVSGEVPDGFINSSKRAALKGKLKLIPTSVQNAENDSQGNTFSPPYYYLLLPK